MGSGLAVIETHPIQYHAPVYRVLQQHFGIPVTAIYGSDFSISGYKDPGFQASFTWDTDLLSGYQAIFLSRIAEGGACLPGKVSARGVAKALKSITPAAVLVTGYHPRFHQMALYQVLKKRHPILFRAETTDHARERGPLLNWMRDHALRSFYRRCARLLYIGQRSLRHFQRLGCPDEKLIHSPYCVDTSPFQCDETTRAHLRPMIREGLGISETQKVLLFSGKLIRHKAPLLFLRAVKQLPPDVLQEVVIVFMGGGELEQEAQKLVRNPPAVTAHFIGFQNQTQLSPHYHAADLVVLPSRHWETWGLVVNEALHHGVPCVVSESVGCAPDLIDPGITGEIFKTESETNLTAAIQRAFALIGHPEIRQICRQKVSQHTPGKAAEGIAKAFWAVT